MNGKMPLSRNHLPLPGAALAALAIICLFRSFPADAGSPAQKTHPIGDVTAKRLLNADAEPGAWLTGGRDYQQSYYSPLKTINKTNVQQLGFAWQYDIDTTDGFEATPIVVDDVMFSSGPKGAVYALDAKSGAERWTFKPEIDLNVMSKICCGPVNRGVAVWHGHVYVASLDGYLYALDANTGAIRWKVDTIIDRSRGYSSTGAPYIAKDLVIIGNSGAEFDARGYITAYDTKTGEERWRFFTVPGNPKQGFEHPELAVAAKTWDPDSLWQVGLGGTVWDGMAYDPKLNLLYIGTGNGGPHPRKLRTPAGGDNLFLCSILAISPDTGRLVWYFQTTPADNWDYDAAQKMILADLTIEGRTRKVIMQATKNGFFYVLDRITGDLISAEPYVQVNWASHVDRKTGRPVETGEGEYFDLPKLVFPSWFGGHNWQPMAFNPSTGLVYIPAIEAPVIFSLPKEPFVYQRGGSNNSSVGIFPVPGPLGLDSLYSANAKELPPLETLTKGQPNPLPRGFLRAWDPVKQHIVWEVDTSGPWAGHPSAMWNGGGVMSTAGGLVFQGRAAGELVALDAQSGKLLHHIDVGTSLMAAPMTYTVNGEQYVAIMAGTGGSLGTIHPPGSAAYRYGNRGRIVAFKLGGGAVPHPPELAHDRDEFPMPPLTRRGTPTTIKEGSELFQRNCAKCHTNTGEGNIPDLRRMSASTHAEFMDILLKGIRADRGMGNFSSLLSPEEVQALHDYLIDLACQTYETTHATPVPHQPDAVRRPDHAPAISADAPVREASLQEVAERMIEGCLKYAADKTLPPLSVAVVDESGALVSFKRQNGASPLTAEAALLKARTAVQTRVSTTDLASLQSQDATIRDAFIVLQLTTLPGGVPLLRSDASLRGAVGVSGAQTAQDAACAQRAVAAVSDAVGAATKQRDKPER